jgi:D-Tyr-tRNAtyr deacylase
MTKKHFELIANTLKSQRPSPTDVEKFDQWVVVVEDFVRKLRTTNDRFNSERFRTACGI